MRLYDIMMSETTLIVRMNIGEWDRQLGAVEEDYCAPLAIQLLSVFSSVPTLFEQIQLVDGLRRHALCF